jgi:uncharacterized protein (TIGR02598 family)
MTSCSPKEPAARLPQGKKNARRGGFSLIEVVVAVGLCSFALSVLASLLPLGLGVIQNATEQIVETEIYNNIWSQANTILFADLNTSPSPFAAGASELYFDLDGNQLPSVTGGGPPAGTVYMASCTLQPPNTTTLPPIDAQFAASSGPGLVLARVQIGYHIDPANDPVNVAPSTDSRVTTRTFLLVKRDGD